MGALAIAQMAAAAATPALLFAISRSPASHHGPLAQQQLRLSRHGGMEPLGTVLRPGFSQLTPGGYARPFPLFAVARKRRYAGLA